MRSFLGTQILIIVLGYDYRRNPRSRTANLILRLGFLPHGNNDRLGRLFYV